MRADVKILYNLKKQAIIVAALQAQLFAVAVMCGIQCLSFSFFTEGKQDFTISAQCFACTFMKIAYPIF